MLSALDRFTKQTFQGISTPDCFTTCLLSRFKLFENNDVRRRIIYIYIWGQRSPMHDIVGLGTINIIIAGTRNSHVLSACPGVFLYFHFLCLNCCVIERVLIELWHFEFLEGGPKTRKSAKNRRTLDLSILVFFSPPPPRPFMLNFFRDRIGSKRSPWKKIRTSRAFLKPEKYSRPTWYRPFFHTNSMFSTLGQGFDLLFGS